MSLDTSLPRNICSDCRKRINDFAQLSKEIIRSEQILKGILVSREPPANKIEEIIIECTDEKSDNDCEDVNMKRITKPQRSPVRKRKRKNEEARESYCSTTLNFYKSPENSEESIRMEVIEDENCNNLKNVSEVKSRRSVLPKRVDRRMKEWDCSKAIEKKLFTEVEDEVHKTDNQTYVVFIPSGLSNDNFSNNEEGLKNISNNHHANNEEGFKDIGSDDFENNEEIIVISKDDFENNEEVIDISYGDLTNNEENVEDQLKDGHLKVDEISVAKERKTSSPESSSCEDMEYLPWKCEKEEIALDEPSLVKYDSSIASVKKEVSNAEYGRNISVKGNEANIETCAVCEKLFSNKVRLALHFLQHTIAVCNNDSERKIFCKLCGLILLTNEELNVHHTKEHDTGDGSFYLCEFCGYVLKSEVDLMKHELTAKHYILDNQNKSFECPVCYENINGALRLFEHSVTHLMKAYKCYICKEVYIIESAYNLHLKIEHNSSKHLCITCDKPFSNHAALKRHLETMHSTSVYTCDVCGKTCASSLTLKRHILRHDTRNRYVCSYCGYQTFLNSDLAKHIRTHTKERPFKCLFINCDRAYRTQSALAQHNRKHLGIRIPCKVCNQTFSVASTLKIHMRVHTGEKPYVCLICNRDFKRKRQVFMHIRNTHEITNVMPDMYHTKGVN